MRDAARVLIVSDEMEVGGSQRQIVHLLEHIDRSQWMPELLYFRNRSFLVDRIEAAGVPTHCIAKSARIDPAFVRKLFGLLRRGNYDVIHCFSLTAEIWVRALLPLLPRPAFVASVRGLSFGYPDWQWWLKRWILRRADAVIANAHAGARRAAQRCGLSDERITVIPNGVDVGSPLDGPERQALLTRLDLPRERIRAVFVGRLVVEKNIPLLLQALALLARERRPFVLLAGDGPLAASLQQQARELGLQSDVRFLGERDDALALMQCADFLVLPSREEGLSNVLLEAMAVGCPPLASAVGGTPELVEHDVTGLLFPDGDAAALADALGCLVTDPMLRRRLGTAAHDKAMRDYTLERLVTSTQNVYRAVFEARQARDLL